MMLDKLYIDNKEAIDEKVKGRKIVVTWSGGWDSVALLAYMAYKYGTQENPILAIHHTCSNINNGQRHDEFLARYRAKKRFKELGLPIKYGKAHFEYDYHFGSKYTGSPQVAMNILASYFTNRDDVVVCFGYVRNDDMWHEKHYFEQAYINLCNILGNENPQILFPFEWTSKQDIYDFLKANNLLRCTTFCESPNGFKPCGTCGSCERVKHDVPEYKFEEQTTACTDVVDKEELLV